MFAINKGNIMKIRFRSFFVIAILMMVTEFFSVRAETAVASSIPAQNSSGNPRVGQKKVHVDMPIESSFHKQESISAESAGFSGGTQPQAHPHLEKIVQTKPVFGPAIQEPVISKIKEDRGKEVMNDKNDIVDANIVAAKKYMIIEKNMAEFIRFEDDVAEVFVANPEIVDVQVDGTMGGYIFARKQGSTTVIVRGVNGNVLSQINIRVTHNLNDLREILKRSFPNEALKVDSTPTGLFISGSVSSSVVAKDVENISAGFLGEKERITNAMTISSPTQILLKVKIAEVNRSVLNQFGINWSAIASPEHFMYGILMGRNPIGDGTVAGIAKGAFVPGGVPEAGEPPLNSYGFQYKDSNTNIASLLDALDAEDLATILAEPNLMAVSGETASFLVGGEFPYPVPQNNSVSVEFKEYGIRLSFVPTVLDASKISLRVGTEVSELDNVNRLTVTVFGGAATTVPGIKTRKAETTVQLGDGQSLAMAGLISSQMLNHYDDIPGLGDIPILSALFRSTKFRKDQTELVIIVTPVSVSPTSDPRALMAPTDNLKRASNIEQLGLQRLNRPTKPADKGNSQVYGEAGFNVE